VDDAAFQSIVGRLDYPMLIVTAAGNGERDGCLVGFATQTSIDPPRFLVCISEKNRTYRIAREAGALGGHLLPAERVGPGQVLGGPTPDETHKLAPGGLRRVAEGVPLLGACPSWSAGRVLERVRLGGEHAGFLLEPFGGEDAGDGWLGFQRAKEIEPGHEA